MKLLIHDTTPKQKSALLKAFGGSQDLQLISNDGNIHPCNGCFACWVKTPTKCVIRDGYHTMPASLRDAEEVILVSECVYGMYSPFVKNVLDRSIGYSHPYFTERGGEMHHKLRYKRELPLRVCFYGETTEAEQETAKKIVYANALNFNGKVQEISFYNSFEELVTARKKGTAGGEA